MALSKQWILQQVVVDVQYSRGWTYYDKCGSLVISLEDALGKPFAGNVPDMKRGEVTNTAERITVGYGPKNFNVTQQWVKNAARVEHIAPMGWEVVAEALNVGRRVTRCGVRFILSVGAETRDAASEALSTCPLVAGSQSWRNFVGEGRVLAHSSTVEHEHVRMRVGLELHEYAFEGHLPPDLAEVVSKYALIFDLDHVLQEDNPYALTKGTLKEFIRHSWQRTRSMATILGEQLGVPYG